MLIKLIDAEHKEDINIPNETFSIFGRMIPSYTDGKWSYATELFLQEEVTSLCFPDGNYSYDEMKGECEFIGAYEGNECIGLAILLDAWFKYLYLYDLKVNEKYRGQGVAAALIEKAKEVALTRGYKGIYTIGQDNNLAACKFYIKSGFRIGGFDTEVYKGTKQEGKADIKFYMDLAF